MSILIDPPLWPAHGTLFSHVVSDSSLEELHAFAAETELPAKAFDLDHYDVPARLYDELVTAGARPVSGAELTRRLIASGLRVPSHQRPQRLARVLTDRWKRLLPQHEALGRELLKRWSEPHRNYHDQQHLLDVLRGIDRLVAAGEASAEDRRPLLLAAWFHDAVYAGATGQDEADSAALARTHLSALSEEGALSAAEVNEVERLVLLTASHAPEPHDAAGRVLCDADLAVLARPWPAYQRYVADVRRDYAHVSDGDFARGRAAVLESLLALTPLFGTPTGQKLWDTAARENLWRELSQLRPAAP
ncbi:DUF4031 domain-containing protein [Zhihengliuella flava]|uniref:Metal-dependent HD superfamily phosphohydrolase n=1 Tax=Zhihengliuella flava TaxID=1285193 RepID=A0A931DCW2_9MICC|nr:putative metal-dependent HD superfamily phosphohydrolase [Zhihengliuella flava]